MVEDHERRDLQVMIPMNTFNSVREPVASNIIIVAIYVVY